MYVAPEALGCRLWQNPSALASIFLCGAGCALVSTACSLAARPRFGPRWTIAPGRVARCAWLPGIALVCGAVFGDPARAAVASAAAVAVAGIALALGVAALVNHHYRDCDPWIRDSVAWVHVVAGRLVLVPDAADPDATSLPGGPVEPGETPEEALAELVRRQTSTTIRPESIHRVDTVLTVDDDGVRHRVATYLATPHGLVTTNLDDDDGPIVYLCTAAEVGDIVAAHRPPVRALVRDGLLDGAPPEPTTPLFATPW